MPVPKRSKEIRYVNLEVPHVEPPAYSGRSYEALAPDTLDLQEMARLAVNGLTEPTDPESDYEVYWRAAFTTNPPVMWHSESDIVQTKFMEALPLMRVISGSDQNPHVERRWMEVMRQMQAPDGLVYTPKRGRPWCAFGEYGKEPAGDQYTTPFSLGRVLGAITLYARLTGDPEWEQAAKRLADGLDLLVIHEGRKARFAWHEFGENREYAGGDPTTAVNNPANYHGWAIQGLANFGKTFGDETSLTLAGKLSRWVMEDSRHFGPDGQFLEEFPGLRRTHFHAHTLVLLSLLDYGLAAGDREAIDFADRGFRCGMANGECLLGYFPEWLNLEGPHTLELCELAEMIALAVKLSRAGAGDYWDMADRWLRNLFTEGQLRRTHWIAWLSQRTTTTEIAPCTLPPYHTTEHVAERNIGAFGGWLTPNDFLPRYPYDSNWPTPGIMHCCTGNSARAIYYVWENVLSCEGEDLRVHLLLNHASPWADVDSHIPYTGQVAIRMKQSLRLSVRLPEWVKPEEARCAVSGAERPLSFDGRYARVGAVKGGDAVTLAFPIGERTARIYVEKRRYHALLRGNTCVAIDPPGERGPLFQRDHFRDGVTRWRKLTRFLPDQSVEW